MKTKLLFQIFCSNVSFLLQSICNVQERFVYFKADIIYTSGPMGKLKMKQTNKQTDKNKTKQQTNQSKMFLSLRGGDIGLSGYLDLIYEWKRNYYAL